MYILKMSGGIYTTDKSKTLQSLADVDMGILQNKQAPVYDSTLDVFTNQNVATSSSAITANLGDVIIGDGSSGITSTNILFVDTINNRVGINVASPDTYSLDIHRYTGSSGNIILNGQSSGVGATGNPKINFTDISSLNSGELGFNDTPNTFDATQQFNAPLMQIGGTSTQTTNGTILKVVTAGGTLPTDANYGVAIGTGRHGLIIETTESPPTNNAVLWVKNDGTGETILRSDNYNITTVGDTGGGNFSLNYNRYHGSAYLQTGVIPAVSGHTINITTIFKNIIPGPLGTGNAWGITGKLLAFANVGGTTEFREFYLTRDASNTWSGTQYSPAGSATGSAIISTVSGSGDNITISIAFDSYLALELTVVAR